MTILSDAELSRIGVMKDARIIDAYDFVSLHGASGGYLACALSRECLELRFRVAELEAEHASAVEIMKAVERASVRVRAFLDVTARGLP